MFNLRDFYPILFFGVLVLIVWFIFYFKKTGKKSIAFPAERFIIFTNLTILLIEVLQYPIIFISNYFFFALFFVFGGIAIFAVTFIWALIYGLLGFKKKGWASFKGFVTCLLVPLITYFVPIGRPALDAEFWLFLIPREKVVEEIKAGKIPISHPFTLLPNQDSYLSGDSRGVEVEQEGNQLRIFFEVEAGFLSDFNGFVYCSDENPPGEHPFTMQNTQIRKLKDHWYFCSSLQ